MMMGVAQVIGMNPTLRFFFSIGAALRERLGGGREREDLGERGERGRGADRLEKRAPRRVLRKHRPHHGGGDDPAVALFSLSAWLSTAAHCELPLRVVVVLGLAAMAPAPASRTVQRIVRIEGVVED